MAKRVIWRLESDRYALTTPNLFEIGEQLPDYYRGNDPRRMGYRMLESLRAEAWEKFAAMDMFFVKVSRYPTLAPFFAFMILTLAGFGFLIHHPYHTASPQREAHDGLLRAPGERHAVRKLGTTPEVEARPGGPRPSGVCAKQQALRQWRASL